MPFRKTRFGFSRMKGPKVKLPKQKNKLPRPKDSRLLECYRRTVTGSVSTRVAAFFDAIGWWDEAVMYFLSVKPLDAAQVKKYEVANKVRTLAIGAGTDGERMNALERVVQLYEKIWADQKPPMVQPFLDKYTAQKAELDAKEKILADRYSLVLTALNTSFKPLGIELAVQASDIPRQYDGFNKVFLSKNLTKVLAEKTKREGLLPVLFSEAYTVLKAASVERDDQGNSAMNFQKFYQMVPKALESILNYCGTVERSKVFKASPDTLEATVTSNVASAVKTPRQPGTATSNGQPKGPRTSFKGQSNIVAGNPFRAGSAIAKAWDICAQGTTRADLEDWCLKNGASTKRIFHAMQMGGYMNTKYSYNEDSSGAIKVSLVV